MLSASTLLALVGLVGGVQNAEQTRSQSSAACTSLTLSLGPSVVQSSGPEYDMAAGGAWNLFNTVFRPMCVVFPRKTLDVQEAMKTIFHTGSNYAVQAGGHSAMAGWNNVEDGILINFSNMRNISYDAEQDSIFLEPGVRWDDAVSTLQSQGVAPVGGRQGDVGTGFLLGGGLSFLSPAHGFAADSFKKLHVVLVNGDLVIATAENEHADLFRALKGGGNRFGIVTHYELYPVHTGTKEDKTWFGGTVLYPNSSIDAVLHAVAHYVENVKDPKAVLLVSLVNNFSGDLLIIANMFYDGTELPSMIFGEFLAIPNATVFLSPLSYFDMTMILPTGADRGSGQRFGASALAGDPDLYLNAYRNWVNFTDTFGQQLTMSVLAFTPVLDPQIQAGRARGGNAMDPPDGGYAIVQISQQFPAGVTNISQELDQGILQLLEQVPRSRGKPLFMNECDDRQNVFETYGTYEQLKQTYVKYDPTLFNMGHTNGPIGL